jgi:hypothetical protein
LSKRDASKQSTRQRSGLERKFHVRYATGAARKDDALNSLNKFLVHAETLWRSTAMVSAFAGGSFNIKSRFLIYWRFSALHSHPWETLWRQSFGLGDHPLVRKT